MRLNPLLKNLRAAVENQSETTVNQLKADGWFTPLWMVGQKQEFPDGQVAISFGANEVEGVDRPVLFTYVNEAEARENNPNQQLMSHPLGVIGLLAHQREVHLAVVDGEEDFLVSHDELLALRDCMQLESDPETRSKAADSLFLSKFETYLQQALEYCGRMPDIRSLHLVAVEPGGAPMQAGAFLEANKTSTHQKALLALFDKQMQPGDRMSFYDSREPGERKLIEQMKQLEPAYVRKEAQGWLARLFSRNKPPQIVILKLEIAAEGSTLEDGPA